MLNDGVGMVINAMNKCISKGHKESCDCDVRGRLRMIHDGIFGEGKDTSQCDNYHAENCPPFNVE